MSNENILYFLIEGEKKINFGNNKKIVLILGNTGAGKSTFTQFLAGDNDKLISQAPDGQSISYNGQYIISDNNVRISDSTINSKTVLPELVIDSKTNTALYDCPGFSDTRSSSIDIAATYFTKKLIDSSEAVKLIIVVNYSSVTEGNDRIDFITLVKHITSFIKDVDKFKDSIALIATKINNNYVFDDDGVPKFVPDNVVIDYIAKFLIRVKNNMINNLVPSTQDQNLCKDKKFCENAIKLIDIFLSQQDGNYTKIGIFRRPNKPGPLSKIKQLQNGKKHIEKILHENIQFTFKSNQDFGYTISDTSKNSINDLVVAINEQITLVITTIGQKLKKFYRSKVERLKDPHKLQKDLNAEYKTLSEIIEGTKKLSKRSEFLKEITKLNNIYPNVYITDDTTTISKQNDYLDFLQLISNKELETKSFEWIEPLRDTQKSLNDLNLWYSFLIDLYDKLSSYEIQKDVERYRASYLDDMESVNKKQELKINQENLSNFLNKLNEIKVRGLDSVKNIEGEIVELETLNNILNITLKQTTLTSCLRNGMVVHGDYVKFSDLSLNKCGYIKFLDVYALNTVFIDRDFEQVGKKLQMAIVAPKWEVINTRRINLDGSSALEHSQLKANDGIFPGARGSDGEPGLPGGPAGNFLGIGEEFINGAALTITANGGQGSKGQDGGNGVKGLDGQTPNDNNFKQFNSEKVRSKNLVLVLYNNFKDVYRYYGTPGTPGGNGGHGGAGGFGGTAGQINILNLGLSHTQNINISNRQGTSGKEGQGGKGGEGGKHGDSIDMKRRKKKVLFIGIGGYKYSVVRHIENKEIAESGKNGIDNYNANNRQIPESSIIFQQHSQIINNYKDYLIENLRDSFKKPKLTQFLDLLNKSNVDKINSRRIRSTNDNDFITSGAPSLSSPLNTIVKWVKNMFSSYKVPNIINGWLTENNELKQKTPKEEYEGFQYENKYIIDPIGFYDQVDSILVLAPVFLHLWNKNFHKKPTKNNDVTLIDITIQRTKIWYDLLEDTQQIVELLKENLGNTQILKAFSDVLEIRKEEMKAIEHQTKVDADEIEALEKNLVALQVDLEDEIKYNKAFAKMKHNTAFVKLMNKLVEDTKKLPEYARKLDSIKLNYSQFSNVDEERNNLIANGMEDIVGRQGEFIVDDYSYVIGKGFSGLGLMGYDRFKGIE